MSAIKNKEPLLEPDHNKSENLEPKTGYKDAMTNCQVFAYAVGHLMNDLVI